MICLSSFLGIGNLLHGGMRLLPAHGETVRVAHVDVAHIGCNGRDDGVERLQKARQPDIDILRSEAHLNAVAQAQRPGAALVQIEGRESARPRCTSCSWMAT
jgi:hypothetical protein